jgi:hypothetical protein
MSSFEGKSLVPSSGSKNVMSERKPCELLGWKYRGRVTSDPVGMFDAEVYSFYSAWKEIVSPSTVCQERVNCEPWYCMSGESKLK